MKVTALHLWSIFTPKSGANAKEREGRMHFGVAQRFAALIAGARQTSLKLRAEASAGLPRSVRGYAGLWRGIALQGQGECSFLSRDCLAGSRGMQVCSAGLPRRVKGIRICGAGWSRNVGAVSCYVPRAVHSFAFGELAHIEALVFCVRAYGRVKEIRFRGAGAHRGACVLRPSSARVDHLGSDKRLHDQVQRL